MMNFAWALLRDFASHPDDLTPRERARAERLLAPVMARYKTPQLQKMYAACLAIAADPASELYHQSGNLKGTPRTGANVRCAFWKGATGRGQEAFSRMPKTMAGAAYQAGREWARRVGA